MLPIGSAGIFAQTASTMGSMEVFGRVRIDGKQEKLSRKRFYLLRGGLKENQALIDRLSKAEIRSRDCFYDQAKASKEFICWLQAENCESPFCRIVKPDEVERVPEFRTAYRTGITQSRNKPDIAREWIAANLPLSLSSGFYTERRTLTETLLGGLKPIQSSMTDSVTVKAIFIDIPLNLSADKKNETFLVSNILPIEFGGKSFLWACEVSLNAEKAGRLVLQVPAGDKPVKGCEVFVRELKVCKTEKCEAA